MGTGGWRAVLFDLDGVLAPTAELHRQAWADLFQAVFAQAGLTPPYTEADYFTHLDGRPREDGVAAVLASRGLDLPWGGPDDPPDRDSVHGLGQRKNLAFLAALHGHGVQPYPEAEAVTEALRRAGYGLAVVSSSANARPVLAAVGLADRFPLVVDGLVASRVGLAGKPAPDTFVYAARSLGLEPAQAVVVEDARSGVAAGRAGGFGLVVGVDRGAGRAALLEAGADLVVDDLTELADRLIDGGPA
ncbi:MAG: beta-phosphoglucomutase family hydrolase [Propionibacteriaceae bacterium]|nr:beta-phosphoglucomutase family hydrolase [Propionibacteriaceae bacterium]